MARTVEAELDATDPSKKTNDLEVLTTPHLSAFPNPSVDQR